MPRKPLFVIDQDFPNLGFGRPQDLFPEVELVPLRTFDAALTTGKQDWEVLRDLRRRGGVDGFVTLDAGMLNLPKEMVVLDQSRMTLVVLRDVDNDPLIAWGLLLVHLPEIVRRLDRTKSQLWRIRRPRLEAPISGRSRLSEIAEQRHQDHTALYREHRLTMTDYR